MATEWYLRSYFQTASDPGAAQMFTDRRRVGSFAVTMDEFQSGDDDALFRILVASSMFQRRQDTQVQRILAALPLRDAQIMGSRQELLRAAAQSTCSALTSAENLHENCDLSKANGKPQCSKDESGQCFLKRHSQLLKRYGDFGKAPTSAALVVTSLGGAGLEAMRSAVLSAHADPTLRAETLERHMSKVWRVSTKIAAMFLSCVANPDLSPGAPWASGVDWRRFVVIDSNVDRFLATIGYAGGNDYEAKRRFLIQVSEKIDLTSMDSRVAHAHNPRLVQQALYLFMSTSNRRTSSDDCAYAAPATCAYCPSSLRSRCAFLPQHLRS